MRNFDYKRLAEKKWDNEIIMLCSKIHEYKSIQNLFIRQKPTQLNKLVEIARIQSTEASNRIEGIVTTSTRIKKLFEEKTIPRNRNEREIIGYHNVLNTIHQSYEYIDINPRHILQLHKDLLKPAGIYFAGMRRKMTQHHL